LGETGSKRRFTVVDQLTRWTHSESLAPRGRSHGHLSLAGSRLRSARCSRTRRYGRKRPSRSGGLSGK
jgi:hypothetical protein